MISNHFERERALEELAYLQAWLDRLEKAFPFPKKGMTKAGIRRMMARIQKELALFEASPELAGKRVSRA